MASNTGEKCKTVSRSLLKSGHALVSFSGKQWQPVIQGLAWLSVCVCLCVCLCVFLRACVCLCMSRSRTWPSLKNSCRISPDTEGWIHELLTPGLFLCSSFLFLPEFEFQFRMRLLDMRVVFLQSREGALPAWRLLTSMGGRASWEGPPAAPAWPP